MDFEEQERRRAVIAEAREMLARLDAEDAIRGSRHGGENLSTRSSEVEVEPIENPVAKWRREAEEAEAKRARERMRTTSELNAQRAADWEAWATAIIARELAAHDRIIFESVGHALGHVRAQLRDEIQEAVGQLRAEFSSTKAERGQVIDLPMLPLMRRSDAA